MFLLGGDKPRIGQTSLFGEFYNDFYQFHFRMYLLGKKRSSNLLFIANQKWNQLNLKKFPSITGIYLHFILIHILIYIDLFLYVRT